MCGMHACTMSCAGGRKSIPACRTVACLVSGQQAHAVSDREGFSRWVAGVGVLLSFGLSFPPTATGLLYGTAVGLDLSWL